MPSVAPSYNYSTGKITLIGGDNVVVGSGLGVTGWSGAVARRGDIIVLDRGGINEIERTIINPVPGVNNQLEIPKYSGPDLVDVDYAIYWISPTRVAGSEAVEDVSRLVNFLNTSGIYVYVDTAATEPDPSYGEDGQSALQPSTGKVWRRESGVWVFKGTFRGFNPRGEYDAGTTYALGDVVSKEIAGASYISLADDNTGNDPATSPDKWMVNSIGLVGPSGATILISNDEPTTDYSLNSIWIKSNSPGLDVYQLIGDPKAWTATGIGLKGATGDAATVAVAGVVTVAAGSPADVINEGTSGAASLRFYIPQGQKGDTGETGSGMQPGASGLKADRGTYDAEAENFVYLATDVVPNEISVKNSATSGDWGEWSPVGGDVKAANNLSDIPDPAQARSNLQIFDPIVAAVVLGG